jgi:hypothetical protein
LIIGLATQIAITVLIAKGEDKGAKLLDHRGLEALKLYLGFYGKDDIIFPAAAQKKEQDEAEKEAFQERRSSHKP